MTQSHLLLVEDDRAITGPLVRALEREGYAVDAVATGRDALARADDGGHHLVLLDLGLPDIDGIDVCRRLRSAHPSLPVLMLTARTDEVDTVVGLDAGADDYVTKPFRLAELLARVRALLRRSTAPGAGEREVAGVRVDPASRRAWRDEEELELTPKEFDLLWLLVSQAGLVVPRDRIMSEVWDANWFGSTKTLDMHVSWLRRKLRDDPTDPELLQTVRGVGYRFTAGS
jgi:DNA-binding response OmpR family regulator